MQRHLTAFLFAHCAAHHIRLPETIAGKFLRKLHNLFLIDENSVSIHKNIFHLGNDILHLFFSAMAGDKIVNHSAVERSRTV